MDVTDLKFPTDYQPGYAEARALAPEIADNYIAHTVIGDPLAEAMTADLWQFSPDEQEKLLQAAMGNDGGLVLRDAPASLLTFFEQSKAIPDWVNFSEFNPGIRMFHRNSRIILVAFVAGVLVEGFTTNIAKSFFLTGRVRDQGVRRLSQNNRHMMEIFLPGGLDRDGDGWKLSVRIRIVHARLRRLLRESGEWDSEAWGVPLSAAHLGYAISAFSARLLKHMKTLGADYNDEEYASFMAVWRYTGYLMGIPESILFRDSDEALRLYNIGLLCEPSAQMESIVMAHALINSAPVVAGMTDPNDRRRLAQYAYRLTRGLIGDTLANQLGFPKGSSFGVVARFRVEERLNQILRRFNPEYGRKANFSKFSGLLETSLYDETGISYRLPDHMHAERSSHW